MILLTKTATKILVVFLTVITAFSIFLMFNSNVEQFHMEPFIRRLVQNDQTDSMNLFIDLMRAYYSHFSRIKDVIEIRKHLTLSNVGRILFLFEKPLPARKKNFTILIYKKGTYLEVHHLKTFGNVTYDPFDICDVKNCKITYADEDLANADAVIFHFHSFSKEFQPPANVTRPPEQRWIFLSDESPMNTFHWQHNDWFNYSGIFNWSMMTRFESDVPVSAGRLVPLESPLIIPQNMSFKDKFNLLVPNANIKRRDVLVAMAASNCNMNRRIEYVKELQKYMKVDLYGACGSEELKKVCPQDGYYAHQCQEVPKYLFYLAFENSNCNGYITEKFYTHSLRVGNIPVIMGMFRNQSDPIAPPNSYIHIEDFYSPKELAEFLHRINDTFEESFLRFHEWRKSFKVLNEDGYMGMRSHHYCRVCQALNYNDLNPKVYSREDLAKFLDPSINCHPPRW